MISFASYKVAGWTRGAFVPVDEGKLDSDALNAAARYSYDMRNRPARVSDEEWAAMTAEDLEHLFLEVEASLTAYAYFIQTGSQL